MFDLFIISLRRLYFFLIFAVLSGPILKYLIENHIKHQEEGRNMDETMI